MADLVEQFLRSGERISSLLGALPGEEALGWPTPCEDWNVRDLVNHVVGEALWVAPLVAGKTISDVGDRFSGDVVGADPAAAWAEAWASASGAVTSEASDVLDRTVHLSYGDVPARDYVAELTNDLVIHGWDLARGLQVDDTIDADLVREVTRRTEPFADRMAGSGMYAPRVEVAPDADEQTRLLAMYGRRR